MKDTLRLKILWTWIKIRANSFIKTLVNNMKRKPTKVPWTLSLMKKKNIVLQKTLHQNRYFTCCYTFFFSQTIYWHIGWFLPQFIYLHFCLLIFIFILRMLKFIQCLYASYIKTSKVLIRFNGLFIRFSSSKCCFLPSYFYEKILPVNKELLLIAKITPGLNTCRCRARAAQFSAC